MTVPTPRAALDLVVVTGLSGAGRSTAAKCLEDLGWFVVDNLPPSLIGTMVDLGTRTAGAVDRVAVVADVRSRAFSSDLRSALEELGRRGVTPRVLFLESADDVLVRRFEGVRRPHPLQGDGRLVDGIAAERALLRDLKGDADLVLDTSDLNVHQLRAAVAEAFSAPEGERGLALTVLSFGYKYGLPVDADLVVDCRFLPNPHWEPALRPLTGRDPAVSSFVLAQEGADELAATVERLVGLIAPGYLREGKRYALLGIGCTGGKHRSVAMTEHLAGLLRERLAPLGVSVRATHRDLGRE